MFGQNKDIKVNIKHEDRRYSKLYQNEKEIEHVAANFNHNRSMEYNTYVPTIKTYKPSNIPPRAYVI